MTTHTIVAVKHVHHIDNIKRFYYRHHHGTPSYSQAFVDWLIEQFEKDNDFFQVVRDEYHELVLKQNAKRE